MAKVKHGTKVTLVEVDGVQYQKLEPLERWVCAECGVVLNGLVYATRNFWRIKDGKPVIVVRDVCVSCDLKLHARI